MTIRKAVRWIPTLIWMGVIFSFSAQTGDASGSMSGSLVEQFQTIVEPIFPTILNLTDFLHFLVRKGAHVLVYFVLGFFTAFALQGHKYSRKEILFRTVLLCGLYAISDEIHQAFVPGRGPSVFDVVIDTVGAFFGSSLFVTIFHNKKKSVSSY